MYQISGLSLKNCDRELPDIHTYGQTYIHTRIKATRCETLRTVTTNNSKKTLTFDLLPQCIINGPKVNGYNFFHFWTHFIDSPWKRSILIRHNQYLNWKFKMSSQNSSPERKVSSYNFFNFWPHFIVSPWKRSILICHNQHLLWNLKMSSQNGSRELKVSSYNFFHFWPHFIDCPWKRSILIYHNHIQYEIFKMSSQIGSIEL